MIRFFKVQAIFGCLYLKINCDGVQKDVANAADCCENIDIFKNIKEIVSDFLCGHWSELNAIFLQHLPKITYFVVDCEIL